MKKLLLVLLILFSFIFATQKDSSTGSATTPNYSFTTDTNTGMYRKAADVLGFTAGGTQRATVDINGITAVTVNATKLIGDGSSITGIVLGGLPITVVTNNYNSNVTINGTERVSGNFNLVGDQWTQMSILDNSGGTAKTFIGNRAPATTAAPYAYFSINRNAGVGAFTDTRNAASEIYLSGASANSYIAFNTAEANNTTPTERGRFTGHGDLAVGTTNASARLDVHGESNQQGSVLIAQFSDVSGNGLVSISANGQVNAPALNVATLSASSIIGALSTAAQTNVTSLGTLLALSVSGIGTINNTVIGGYSNYGLIQKAVSTSSLVLSGADQNQDYTDLPTNTVTVVVDKNKDFRIFERNSSSASGELIRMGNYSNNTNWFGSYIQQRQSGSSGLANYWVGYSEDTASNQYANYYVATTTNFGSGVSLTAPLNATPFAWANGSTEVMRISTGNNLGIGNNNPKYKVDVTGQGNFSAGVSANSAQINGGITSNTSYSGSYASSGLVSANRFIATNTGNVLTTPFYGVYSRAISVNNVTTMNICRVAVGSTGGSWSGTIYVNAIEQGQSDGTSQIIDVVTDYSSTSTNVRMNQSRSNNTMAVSVVHSTYNTDFAVYLTNAVTPSWVTFTVVVGGCYSGMTITDL